MYNTVSKPQLSSGEPNFLRAFRIIVTYSTPSWSQALSSEGETAVEEEVLDVPELLGLANTLTNPNNRKWKSSPKTELWPGASGKARPDSWVPTWSWIAWAWILTHHDRNSVLCWTISLFYNIIQHGTYEDMCTQNPLKAGKNFHLKVSPKLLIGVTFSLLRFEVWE